MVRPPTPTLGKGLREEKTIKMPPGKSAFFSPMAECLCMCTCKSGLPGHHDSDVVRVPAGGSSSTNHRCVGGNTWSFNCSHVLFGKAH